MKSTILFILLIISNQQIINAQVISNDKDNNNYFGVFGETIGSGISQSTYNTNIGRDFIEASINAPFLLTPILKLNPNSGAPVQIGGEVNRVATSSADLLPYAYGRIVGIGQGNPIIGAGTGNYTMTQSGNLTIITLNENIAFETSITITPTSIPNGEFNISYPRFPVAKITNNNTIEITFFDHTGSSVNHPYFSFVVFAQ